MPLADFKNEEGQWMPYKTIDSRSKHTKSFQLYKDMLLRCIDGGKYQTKYSSYVGCSTSFQCYQSFADWCNKQVGYGAQGYELDKDILVKDNKIYGPETCVFVPRYINALVKTNKHIRGNCPIGVHYCKERNKYVARLSTRSGPKTLGRFNTIEEAFVVYKVAKEAYVKQVAEEWKDRIDPRAYIALVNFTVSKDD